MSTTRRLRTAADVALGYCADSRGNGIGYASISTGNAQRIVRFTFNAKPIPALEGRETGYAAMSALSGLLKARGFGRIRIRLADEQVARELGGSIAPPKALSMAYVRVRCALNGLGSVRIEAAEPIEIRDLAARATAEVRLLAAA